MKLSCPECGAIGSAGQFSADAEARECMKLVANAPGDTGPVLLQYMVLFRPPKRALAWGRARRLLEDLLEMMHSPALNRGGRDHPVTPQIWRQAIEQMLDQRQNLTLPLKTHGYLLAIVAGIASKKSDDAEGKREAELRSGLRRGHGADERAYHRRLIASENAARKQFGQAPMTPAEERKFLERELNS